jgi:hypothetical protein
VETSSSTAECATGETLVLDVGNGTYAGPADYTIDPQGGGGVTFHIDNQLQFHVFGGAFSTVCKVTVASAPATGFAPPGSQIGGTFACMGLVSDPLNDGGTAMVDLAQGAFNVVIR